MAAPPNLHAATTTGASARVRVVCVEDNRTVAEALRTRFMLEPGLEWVEWLPSADALVSTVERERPGVLLLDIDMPGRDAFAALEEAMAVSPNTRAIIFTGHVRKELVDRAISAGAWGYISKEDGPAALVLAISGVLAGEFVLSPAVQAVIRH